MSWSRISRGVLQENLQRHSIIDQNQQVIWNRNEITYYTYKILSYLSLIPFYLRALLFYIAGVVLYFVLFNPISIYREDSCTLSLVRFKSNALKLHGWSHFVPLIIFKDKLYSHFQETKGTRNKRYKRCTINDHAPEKSKSTDWYLCWYHLYTVGIPIKRRQWGQTQC